MIGAMIAGALEQLNVLDGKRRPTDAVAQRQHPEQVVAGQQRHHEAPAALPELIVIQ